MAVIKRQRFTNKKKKIFYQAQVYIRGVRVAYKSFNTRLEATIWHEEQKKKLKEPLYFLNDTNQEYIFQIVLGNTGKRHFLCLKEPAGNRMNVDSSILQKVLFLA